jgi:3-hydroxybutyryl-CoA dehydrogenase
MQVGVVGAGLMGSEIALTFAVAGFDVVLVDRSAELLAGAVTRLHSVYDRGAQRGALPAERKEAALARLTTTTDVRTLSQCGFVTEAVFEQEDVKAELFRQLDGICAADCIFASNTSTIPMSSLAAQVSAERRKRFIGTHYFSPVTRMKLVEVIPAFDTAREVVETTLALCSRIGKTPIEIKDVAGFAVNRLLHAFLIEAVRLVEEGVATPADIDTACRLGLGHPLGPFELMDATTSSLCLQVQGILQDAYGERFRPRPLLKQRVTAGLVGGRGKPGWRSGAA